MQVSQELAKFETCGQWQSTCTSQDTVTMPLKATVGYAFIARGSMGHTGRLNFSLQCDSTAGTLPAWVNEAQPGELPAVNVYLGPCFGNTSQRSASNPPAFPSLRWAVTLLLLRVCQSPPANISIRNRQNKSQSNSL